MRIGNGICPASIAAAVAVLATPAVAQTPRDLLTQASFGDRDKGVALRHVQTALAGLGGDGGENALMRATALGYRAKLTGSRSDLSAARKLFDALVAVQPRNAEGQLGLGAWHLATINRTGSLLGRVFGASRGVGNAALDRAVALGGDHALFAGLAALLRINADPSDARGRQLAEQASRAGATTTLDRIMQRSANAILVPLRAGDRRAAAALAERLLPFGQIDGVS